MTVCIAGINHSNQWALIIAAADRKVSFFGGWVSAEGVAMKMTGLNKDWTVMLSGPISPMVALIDAIRERTEKLSSMGFRPFARLCREVYREERKPLIESEVLGDYDIENYAEYVALRKSDPVFHKTISDKIKDVEQEWSLLFAGFDKQQKPHIFTITDNGKIDFCDKAGFAAIGSGAWRGMLTLSSYTFKRNLPLSEAIFGIASAKFAAEGADGVGQETILAILEPRMKMSPVFQEVSINSLKKMWMDLPRFPGEKATLEIWKQLEYAQQLGWLKNPKLRSASRKSAGLQ